MIEAHGAADHVDASAAAPVAQDLVALAELLALELEDARRRRVGLAAQPVALAVGDERQLAGGQTPRLGLWRLEPAASASDDVKPQVARERRQLETERGGELGAAVEGAAQLEEVQRLAERIGGRGPGIAMAGDVRDADYLASTFAGADAVYTLTALDPTLPDYHADQDRRGEAIASAIRESGVRHVVALSSIGGELASGNGFVASLHRQERRLRALDGVNLMILRPGAFFEGFYAALETIRHDGVVADSVAPDAKLPMIATADIAPVAATALRERNWSGAVVRELLGPRDLTYAEAAAAIGKAISEPDLQYVQLPDEELVAILTEAAGFSPDFAALFVEFNQALSEGRLHSLEGRNERNTTPTEFEEFAGELAQAYAATA
jgi:uncharacterized protein YbjT (DUF2867 family)